MSKKLSKIGSWAFLVGVILAIVAGVFSALGAISINSKVMASILAVLGLVIGILNISNREVMPFLVSCTVLIIASMFGVGIMSSIPGASEMLASLLLIFVPAAIIVAIKNVFSMAKN